MFIKYDRKRVPSLYFGNIKHRGHPGNPVAHIGHFPLSAAVGSFTCEKVMIQNFKILFLLFIEMYYKNYSFIIYTHL